MEKIKPPMGKAPKMERAKGEMRKEDRKEDRKKGEWPKAKGKK